MSTLKKLLVLLLVIISIATVAGLSACVTPTPTVTPTTLSATQAGGSGTIRVEGALDGVSWHGPVNFTLTQQSGGSQTYSGNYSGSGNSVSSQYNGVPLGNYLVAWVSGGPSGGPPTSITAMQSLTDNGTITFVMGWSTLATTRPATTPPATTLPATTLPATTPATTPTTTYIDLIGVWSGTTVQRGPIIGVLYYNMVMTITEQEGNIVFGRVTCVGTGIEGNHTGMTDAGGYSYPMDGFLYGSRLDFMGGSVQISGNSMTGSGKYAYDGPFMGGVTDYSINLTRVP